MLTKAASGVGRDGPDCGHNAVLIRFNDDPNLSLGDIEPKVGHARDHHKEANHDSPNGRGDTCGDSKIVT
eukprot:36628-Alexandrium_andersonii.AAC.1